MVEEETAAQPTETSAASLHLQCFTDVNFLAYAPEGQTTGFETGSLDLFGSSHVSDHWSALAEVILNAENGQVETEIERVQLTYENSDALRISVGAVHNPLVRWAVTNDHGALFQTPIDKPTLAGAGEHFLWPILFVGALASGRLPGAAGITYDAGIGNGRGSTLDQVLTSSDLNRNKARVISLGLSPDALPGVNFYASGYFDKIPAEAGLIRERIYTLSASYLQGATEIRAEWSRMAHRPQDLSSTLRTDGWYALASHRLSGRWSVLRPYVFVEGLRPSTEDTYLDGAERQDAWSAGLRWDIQPWIAIKGEYRSLKQAAAEGSDESSDEPSVASGDRRNTVRFQLAISF